MDVDTLLSARVAEEVRAALARRGINKSELARRLGVSHTWVTNRLAGHQEIGLNELQRIAEVLGVSSASLLPPAGGLPTRGSGSANRRRDRRDAHTPSVLAVTIPGPSVRPQASRPPNYPRAARRPIVSSGFAA